MNEKLKELIYVVCMEDELEVMSRMTPDEVMEFLGCTVDVEGEILDADENPTGIWYDEINKKKGRGIIPGPFSLMRFLI